MSDEATPSPFLDAAVAAPFGDTPVGRDLTYEAHFEQLSQEIEKLNSISGEAPDWGHVRQESGRILREESKDFRVASWWVAATAATGTWADLASAVTTYQAIVERYWAEMHPPAKRARARAGLVGWLWESLGKSVPPKSVALADGDAVRAFEAGMTALDGAFSEKLGDASPMLGSLRNVIRDKVRSIPQPAAAAAAPEPTAAPTPSVRGGAAQAPPLPASLAAPIETGPVTSLDEAENAAGKYKDALMTLATHARQMAPTAPWPYRLNRAAAWIALESAPAVEGGKTFARAPRAPDRQALSQMFDGGQWEALREGAENALSENPLWLDLHRYTAIALERLGPTFAAARAAVGRETAGLVERIPSLPTLLYANGTPFASPETVDWLAQERTRYGDGGGGKAASGDDGLGDLLSVSDAKVAAGQVDEGLADLLAAGNAAPTARGRFRARLTAAQVAHRSGKTSIAEAILVRMMPEIDATLEAWEPAVCAEFFEIFLKVDRSLSSDGGERQTLLFRRLLQLDPAAALRNG